MSQALLQRGISATHSTARKEKFEALCLYTFSPC